MICSLFGLAAAGMLAVDQAGRAPSEPLAWSESPYRNFGSLEAILAGRVEVHDEADDRGLREALAADLTRLWIDLHEKQGWRVPFADGDPLRIFVARKTGGGWSRLAVMGMEKGRLRAPSIQLDALGLSNRQIVRQVARLYSSATLSAYNVSDRTFLTVAAAEFLASSAVSEEERAETREAAAAPSLDLAEHAASLGRLYVEEFARSAGGPVALRAVWERASETGEEVLPLFLRSYTDWTGEKESALLVRFAARLYTLFESEAAPSRMSLSDLQMGTLDAGPPLPFVVRHRVYVPPMEASGAFRITWPEIGAPAAAVVRYRDAALPADVVFLSGGEVRTIPLAGVARVDWVVAGTPGAAPLSAPALFETLSAFPFVGLVAQAASSAEGSRVWWTTASHEGLAGWAIFREELLPDGRIARTGPDPVPASDTGKESFRYVYVDSEVTAGTYYRYTVLAVTEDGLLAKAFSATLRTPE